MSNAETALDGLAVISDPLRGRIALLLEQNELTVSELCSVFQMPQSTMSRNLRLLSEAGWIVSRPDGPRRLYQSGGSGMDKLQRQIWALLREPLQATPAAGQDRERAQSVLARRRRRSQEFFAGAADRWDRLRDELFGPSFYLISLLGLVESTWCVGDLGCGTGPAAEGLAPFVNRVIAVDGSAAMVAEARQRLERFDNVDVRPGDLEQLPLRDGELDAATLVLVLHHLPEPARVVREVARTLRPGGKLLLVDMIAHEREEYRTQMGHVWLGFARERIERQLVSSGFRIERFHQLPPHPEAKGPNLFCCVAERKIEPGAQAAPSEV